MTSVTHHAQLNRLDQLASIKCDPLNIGGYFDECSLFCLNGVSSPFWRNWPLADPSSFLTPEALHHWHREFYDHDVWWCLRAVGAQELDFRFSVLQQLTTFRHFKDGISNLKQVTGRAQHNMQHYMVALITDAAPLCHFMTSGSGSNATWKYGRYDAAIFAVDDTKLQQWPTSGLKGHTVVEVHLIMQPLPPQQKSTIWAACFLAYVQCLDVVPQRHGSSLEHTTHMHILKCAMQSARVPFGDILPLDQLHSFAHIVPRFGPAADSRLTAENSTHSAQVIASITPAEYMAVLAFTSEERDFEVRAKFTYFEDTQELQIMPPLPVHEQPAAHLSKAINKFMDALPYDKLSVDVTIHLNHRIQNKDTTNIPDLHIVVMTQPPEDDSLDDMEISKPVSKWVGKCGLSSDYDFMVWKLRIMCDSHRDIDLALIMSFKERVRWQQPKEMKYEEFIPARIKKNLKFGPVTLHSHVWIDISEVRYSVFRCSMDGHFDFNSRNPDTFGGGTLYLTVEMSDVECMLRDGANALKEYIISLMEGMSLEESAIYLVCDSNPSFEPILGAGVNQISSAIYLTAYCHYLDWCNHKYSKHKISQTAQSLRTGDQNIAASISSDPTTLASSSDPTFASSDLTVPFKFTL
ncbi:uncharacterized protein F5147DRAFT_775869 [Suillus discolor]|uniref:DUF6830 domain-containing protein n=1 Tax=Suillus discolor TaxID=1912936 RepID=A0A9P7F3J9_9AGAM|nr:uncharacterized protein F5147DRAFT_775869 [Suillus discolor]KAG2103743.1 hypothetical protein F5147DRAFT_775869 [Suillus discolor]